MKRLMDLIAVALLVACATVVGCGDNAPRMPDAESGGPSPVSSSVAAALVEQAPVIGKTSFGPGVHVSIFKPTWLFSEARVVDDRLYVMYYAQGSQRQQIATLSRGVLHPVQLAHDYWVLSFENDNRLISAKGSGSQRDWYELRGGQAIAVSPPASPVYGLPHHVLADGDTCTDGMAGTGSALDDIVAHRRVSILTDAAMSHATNGVLEKAIGVWCDHFHGKNYATMDVPGVIFRLDGKNVSLISAGWIEAANDHYILIETQNVFIEAEVR
ncbi:MAG TPA: hypothetical protein VFO25_10845 [Candidatus Eremiobacteraceae bacterium]|nr:hypothetical protein [Candidatus Eremiobacteraceae bacterium]